MSKHQRSKKAKTPRESELGLTPDREKSSFNWFPGHMTKALRKIKERIKQVDIVLEIRDARSPIATGNYSLWKQVGNKSRLIVMNKANLGDPAIIKKWQAWFETQEDPFIFVNGLDKKSLEKVLRLAREVVKNDLKKANPDGTPRDMLKMMIIGLPNTGKSTIINKLSNRDASKVADKPGQTQQQLWVNVSKNLQILDTPGVMPPTIESDEQVLWLAALHAIPDRITDNEEMACFIIEHLSKHNPSILAEHYKFEALESYDLVETLNAIAKARGCIKQGHEFDYERVYKLIIHDFRHGELGPVHFGLPPK